MAKRLSITFLLLLLGIATAPAWAQPPYRTRPYAATEHSLRLRLGSFLPAGDSQYWEDNEQVFTGDADDFEDVSFGIDYLLGVSPRFGVLFSGNVFEGQTDQSYLDFEDNFGDPIVHDTTLELASLTVGGVFFLTEPGAAVRPYVGAGGGLYSWRIEESGDFIVFDDPPEIFDGIFEDEGEAFGVYVQAGLEVPIGDDFAFFAEGRFDWADDELSGDFEGLGDLDLSGRNLAAGFAWRF